MPKDDEDQPCIIAIDIGTTAIKFVVFSIDLKELFFSEVKLATYRLEQNASEQDAEEVWQAIKTSLTGLGKKFKNPQALCFSAAMHSLLAVNKFGEALSKAILWSDLRSKEEALSLRNSDVGQQIYQGTGTPIHPMSPLAKIIWLKKAKPALFKEAYKFISIKEYILFKLTGQFVIDYGMASATGIFAPSLRKWHPLALQVMGIGKDNLSKIISPTEPLNILLKTANALNIPKDITIISGSSDGCLANLGDEATEPGVYAISIGTSGAVRTVSERFETDKKMRLFSYMLQEKSFVHGGAVNNGAIALEWLGKSVLGSQENPLTPVELIAIAEEAEVGAEGLLFLPYLQGERAPFWNPDLQSSFVHMHIQHQQKHIARAVMEGVMYNINYVMQTVASLHPPPQLIKASGGFTRSAFWVQMLADISNCEVQVNDGMLSAARGAAMLALEALNYPIIKQGNNASVQSYLPDKERHTIYHKHFMLFSKEVEKLI